MMKIPEKAKTLALNISMAWWQIVKEPAKKVDITPDELKALVLKMAWAAFALSLPVAIGALAGWAASGVMP